MKGNCFYITCKAFAGQVELIFLVLGKFHIPPKNECKVIFSCKNPAQLEKNPQREWNYWTPVFSVPASKESKEIDIYIFSFLFLISLVRNLLSEVRE